jgi:hypothetical protein
MANTTENPWNTHDFKVKMLDWSAARGSRLAHTCRRCGRGFSRFTLLSVGRTLETAVSNQWLSEDCPRVTNENDDKDRKRLRDPTGQ